MPLRKASMIKVLLLSASALLILAMSAATLYLGLSAKESFAADSLYLLAVTLIAALLAGNFVYFRSRTAKLYPAMSRALPIGSVVAVGLYFFIQRFYLDDFPSSERVLSFYALVLAAWFMLNLIISFTIRGRAAS